ncbi:MAG: T9SS type A sorting domain-containing protein [Muribaculaceae bacterium]|nr:T9SS type A sorting domain-containing protein [Muribaculaceae bacterium]
MKKLLTMLGCLAIGAGSMVAAPVDPGIRTDLKVAQTPENFQRFHQMVQSGAIQMGETLATRKYEAADGTVYEAKFQLSKTPLCEMLMFSNENGEPRYYSFDELPYYVVVYNLYGIPKGDVAPNTQLSFYMEWPSEYIYSQVFDWTGERDENNQIPLALREYAPASFDELWNNADRCRLFREAKEVGVSGSPANGKWDCYFMLPNEFLGMGGLYNGKEVVTELSETIYSQIKLQQFDADELFMDFENNIRLLEVASGAKRIARVFYKGSGEIQGFVEQTFQLPEWGDLHLFNAGQISSDLLGDNNPFPTDFPEYTLMYFAIGDKEFVEWEIAPDAKKFAKEAVMFKKLEVAGDDYVRSHLNCLVGFTFVDKKYKDITLNPDDNDFNLYMGESEGIDLGDDMWYYTYTPELCSLVPPIVRDMNGVWEPWSEEYGCILYVQNLPETTLNNPVNIGWGFKQGFIVNYQNDFLQNYTAQSTGKLLYHYNPDNIQEYRELELVGGKDAVETVAADAAKISAANGVITVVAAENANVAVYGLDGVCLKNVKAAAGETVSVEAAKGVYVVTVNGASKKVAL